MSLLTGYWVMAATVGLVLVYKIYTMAARPKHFPPGPPTAPIVGNLLQLHSKDSHLQFDEWTKQYGDITHLKLGTSNVIILNTRNAVRELFEKRSNIYSTRPNFYFREFFGNSNMVLRDNDDVWRQSRKIYHLRLNSRVADTYTVYQSFDSLQLLNDLLIDPDQFSNHLSQYTTSVASTLFYGLRTTKSKTGYAQQLIDYMHLATEAQKFQLIDLFPFIRPLYRLLPTSFSTYKTNLGKIKAIEEDLFMKLLEQARADIANGNMHPSFINDMLLVGEKDKMDTQWGTALGFVKAMVLYPEVQKAAQKEIDEVVGSQRLPTWEDRDSLPYIRGILEETYRWSPVGMTNVPHSVSRDDTFNGHTIPAGSTILMNVWSLNNHGLSNPRDFDPLRHSADSTLVEQNSITPESQRRAQFTFGAGRRICPGFHVAQRGLFIAISRMIWGFEFGVKRGVERIERDAFTQGLACQPAPFECEIKARDSGRAEIMRKAWNEAQVSLDDEGNFTDEFFERGFAGKTI